MKPCVIVTGASKGIGRQAALAFAEKGYAVIGTARHEEGLAKLAAACPDFSYVVGDVGTEECVNRLFKLQAATGPLKSVINNAGISIVGLLQDLSLEEWNNLFRCNVTGAFLTSRKAIDVFLTQKPFDVADTAGSIVNVSSVWGIAGASCEVAYSATKGAVNAFTKALARELAPSKIRVNAAAFGTIDTSMNNHLTAAEKRDLAGEIGMERFGTAREAADLLVDLALNHPYLTGQIITMDGSWI